MKKRNLLVTLACSALLLTSCDKITATLPNGDDKLVGTIDIDHNTLSRIYDTIKGGDNYASNVNDILTQAIADAVLGNYSVVLDSTATGGYKIVLNGYDGEDDATKTAFINSHSAYNNWSSSSYKLTLDTSAPTKEEFEARINIVKNLIDKQIVSTMWSEANSSSYKRNNRFYEVLYARNLSDKLYDITDGNGETISDEIIYDDQINYEYGENALYKEVDGAFDGFNEYAPGENLFGGYFSQYILIDGTYDTSTVEGRNKIKSVLHLNYYIDYINSSIMPTIMKNLLVEQYVLEEQYIAIGNTGSRKVNYISITNNEAKDGDNFFDQFLTTYFTGSDNEKLELTTDEKFTIASDAWKGDPAIINTNEDTLALAESVFGKTTDKNPSANADGHDAGPSGNEGYIATYASSNTFNYFEDTPYADIIDDYSTLTNNITTNNATNYSSFTEIDSISYEPIVGLAIKTDSNRVTDYTTYGWQTKDSSSLPDEIKNKLFAYGFINEWNSAINSTDKQYQGSYLYEVGDTGKYLLRKDTYSSLNESILWEASGAYYVVQVEDIITPDSTAITDTLTSGEKSKIEENAREAAYTLASGSTYTTNAMIFYLEQCNINYHDQDVYDYFVSTYPRLFE